MIYLYDPVQERLTGDNLLRSRDTVVGNGTSHTFTLQGRKGRRYGINALQFHATQSQQKATLALNDGDRTLFSGVDINCLNDLFASRAYDLAAPIVVPRGDTFDVTVDNQAASDSDDAILVQGLPKRQLDQRRSSIEQKIEAVPTTDFAYASESVSTNTTAHRISVDIPYGAWITDHIQISPDDGAAPVDVDVKVIKNQKRTILSQVNLRALNDFEQERLAFHGTLAFNDRDVLEVVVDNNSGASAAEINVLVPLYEQTGDLEPLAEKSLAQ